MSTVLKTLRIKTDVVLKIKKLADKENRSFTNMVETILIREYERKESSLSDR